MMLDGEVKTFSGELRDCPVFSDSLGVCRNMEVEATKLVKVFMTSSK